MNRLAEVINRPEPTMAVTFSGNEAPEAVKSAVDVADVAELRADLLPTHDPGQVIMWADKLTGPPALLTVRSHHEGGRWNGSEARRLGLICAVMEHFDGVDIEQDADIRPEVTGVAHDLGKVVIASWHDYRTTPSLETLEERFISAKEAEADWVKFAVTTQTFEDYRRAAEFTFAHKESGVIVVGMDRQTPYGMSQFGRRSRISFPWLGSRMTYASAAPKAVAPGQMTCQETHDRLVQRYTAYAALSRS